MWELDPDVKAKILSLSLRAAMKEKLARKVADAAKGQNVTATINAAVQQEVDRALFELFGAKPAKGYYVVEETKQRGLLKSFFGYLYSQAQQVLSSAMAGQSPSSDSKDNPNP